MEIYHLEDKLEYLDEVATLEYEQWAVDPQKDKEDRLQRKREKICEAFDNEFFCKLILIEQQQLIGFISIFPKDGEEETQLAPWYATMYVKEQYRNRGYSKILNDAILKEAKKRGVKRLYLKTDLENYYEKFGAVFLKKLKSGEKLYQFEI